MSGEQGHSHAVPGAAAEDGSYPGRGQVLVQYLDQVCSWHLPLLKMLLPMLLLDFQGKPRAQDALWGEGASVKT